MKEIQFLNEHLWPGRFGHGLIVLAFISSLVAAIAWFLAGKEESKNIEESNRWRNLARIAFRTHALSVVGVFVCLFYIIYNHLFEYYYAYSHSSKALPVHYIISSFWEGQEGSFLLWMLWHALLGWVLMRSAKKYEDGVMSFLSLTQLILGSMLLGVYVGSFKIGSSPFILLREAMSEAPIFQTADYLKQYVQDGNGLNPLLQNFWMTIHPPMLFMGFASTIVPTGFALAGLWKKDYAGWIHAALPWTLFNVCILGIGIMMGGMWAYESLNFGGYWAWDPVENASLVPWLVMVAGLHTLLIYKHTGKALFTTYLLLISGFFLILYSTFLTRSGVLGNSSVHSFTDLGLSGQLLVLMIGLGVVSFGLLFIRRKQVPAGGKVDEQVATREFWLFTGAIILFVSAFQISTTTSIPAFNKFITWSLDLVGFKATSPEQFSWAGESIGNGLFKLLGGKLAPPKDVFLHYHKFQIPLAILILTLTVLAHFLKYKKDSFLQVYKKLLPYMVASVVLSIAVFYVAEYQPNQWQFFLYLFACFFAIIGNGALLIKQISAYKKNGSVITHAGFAIMLFGVLISSANKKTVSINTKYSYGKNFTDKEARENMYLRKGQADSIQGYRVTYLNDTTLEPNHYYRIQFEKGNEKFVLQPNAQVNPKMGLISNPDTKHYFSKDLFTYVSSVPSKDNFDKPENYLPPRQITLDADTISTSEDTILTKNSMVIFTGVFAPKDNLTPELENLVQNGAQLLMANFKVRTMDDRFFELKPVYAIMGNEVVNLPAENKEVGLNISLDGIDFGKGPLTNPHLHFTVNERKEMFVDYVILKAIEFPFINLVWWGTMVMMIGFGLSIMQRYRDAKRYEAKLD